MIYNLWIFCNQTFKRKNKLLKHEIQLILLSFHVARLLLVWFIIWNHQSKDIFQAFLKDSSNSRLKFSKASSSDLSKFKVLRTMFKSCSDDNSGSPVEIIIASKLINNEPFRRRDKYARSQWFRKFSKFRWRPNSSVFITSMNSEDNKIGTLSRRIPNLYLKFPRKCPKSETA